MANEDDARIAETLPPDSTLRAPTMDDLSAASDTITASDMDEFGEPNYSEEELRGEWEDLDLTNDVRIVVLPDGRVAGYASSTGGDSNIRLDAEVYVHPEDYGRGIGTALVRWTEARAREKVPLAPEGARVYLNNFINARNDGARSLLEREGYAPERHFWQMVIDLDETPASPAWPEGIAVRPCASDEDERLAYEAVHEAFRDHWGWTPTTFETWSKRKKQDGFDRNLWFLALDGDQVAAAVICGHRSEMGWVHDVAVRRPWRRRGLGEALLRHAFAAFHARGTRTVGLGVDAQSPTGATRLYDRAGMRVNQQYAAYQKELRPGADIDPEANA